MALPPTQFKRFAHQIIYLQRNQAARRGIIFNMEFKQVNDTVSNTGVVKWFDEERGYGFLDTPDGDCLSISRQRNSA